MRNKGEYKVNRCYFQFSEEYTDDLVKKAIFEHGDTKIEVVIANNECDIPYEVLNFDTFELRVYAYQVDGDDLVLRYSSISLSFIGLILLFIISTF